MIQAHVAHVENHFLGSDNEFSTLKDRLASTSVKAMTHSEVEALVTTAGRELLRRLFEDHLRLRAGEEREAPALRVVGKDEVHRHHRRDTERALETVFGGVTVERIGYSAAGTRTLFPLDGVLNLPPDGFSFGVRKQVAVEAARGSFDEAVASISRTSGAHVAKRQAEQLARRAACDFDAFYLGRAALTPDALAKASALLVLTLDGKGIVVREADLRDATRKAAKVRRHKMGKRLSPGEKKYRKRMAMVAAVYTVDRHVRTADEIVDGPPLGATKKRPRPEGKRVWASIEKNPEKVVREIFAEALRRDPSKTRTWIALSDGNEPQLDLLEQLADEHGIELTIILDVIHVLEYLWDATTALNPPSTPEAEEWVSERLRRILRGGASDVAAGMRRSATLRKLTAKERGSVDDCADYLQKYRNYLYYDLYLERGMPIATGVIEGACRHLIKDRMDITGARWSLAGAEAVLRLRSLRSSDDFEDYWRFHEAAEHARNHSVSYQDDVVPKAPVGRRAHLKLVP